MAQGLEPRGVSASPGLHVIAGADHRIFTHPIATIVTERSVANHVSSPHA